MSITLRAEKLVYLSKIVNKITLERKSKDIWVVAISNLIFVIFVPIQWVCRASIISMAISNLIQAMHLQGKAIYVRVAAIFDLICAIFYGRLVWKTY